MEFYSHLEPEKILLKEHLKYVGRSSKGIIESKEFNWIDKNVIADISYLIGIAHDFGKYTTFFQEKLKGCPSGDEANHSLISALCTFNLVKRYLMAKKLADEEPYKFLHLISYFVVKHHHGDLKDIEKDVNAKDLFNAGFRNISKQLSDIKNNRKQIEEEYAFSLQDYDIQADDLFVDLEKYEKDVKNFKDIKPLVMELDKSAYVIKHKNNQDIRPYLLVQLLYSSLIDSDKKHAGSVREIGRKELSENLVELYLSEEKFKKENESTINPIRTEIRKSVLENIESEYNKYKIFTITAPTGTGKTLTSLSAALKLRKLLKNKLTLRCEPRIIYSLPFTSIIDQNFKVFDSTLEQVKDFKENRSQYLLKHHHLSEIFYKTSGMDKEKNVDESLVLIESWESEIIVTTFIQLFHTLIGYKNRSLKKFHNIVNSIIILDEVQNIPIGYWNLIRSVLIAMAKHFNCRIILMTATKPLIFEEGEYKELVDDYEKYFKSEELNRVCLYIDGKGKQISDFCEELTDLSKNSYLFVFNTIGASFEFYSEIKDRIQELGFKLYYLSTNIIPKERRKRIKEIRDLLKSNQKVVVVSTQLVEAGVDIDCDCVYRDMGPLDSIIQVAGRCNRNKRNEMGDVRVIDLGEINEGGVEKKYADYIYDKDILKIVRDLFEDKNEIMETEFLELINEYFKEARAKSQEGPERKLINSIYELYFFDKTPDKNKRIPISEFELIKEDYYTIDVFVEIDDKAREIWEKYQEIKNNKKLEPYERKKEFLKIKSQFYDYVISIPQKCKNQVGFDEKNSVGHISKYEIEQGISYDQKTGFKSDDGALIY